MPQEKVSYIKVMGFEFPIHHAKLINYTIVIYLLLTLCCIAAVHFFNYEMTSADIPGGLVAGFLLAYLITIL